MFRSLLALTLPVLLVGAAPAGAAPRPVSHSGLVKAMDPDRRTLTLEEMGRWTGPATRPITRSIALTPATSVRLIRRSESASEGGWPGGYVESPSKVEDIRPGDFVTVSVARQGRRLVAVSVDVVRLAAP